MTARDAPRDTLPVGWPGSLEPRAPLTGSPTLNSGEPEKAGAGKRAMKELLGQRQAVRRFAASHRNEIWMGDCQHTLHLPDPDAPDRRRQVYLLAFLDDYSRLIPHAEFYWQERLPKLEDCLKKAILRCGAPQSLYVDNGSIYVAEQLQRICGELCIEMMHSRPGRPLLSG